VHVGDPPVKWKNYLSHQLQFSLSQHLMASLTSPSTPAKKKKKQGSA
jgi:hypothetical protein